METKQHVDAILRTKAWKAFVSESIHERKKHFAFLILDDLGEKDEINMLIQGPVSKVTRMLVKTIGQLMRDFPVDQGSIVAAIMEELISVRAEKERNEPTCIREDGDCSKCEFHTPDDDDPNVN